MILHCDFEELQALDRGADLLLDAHRLSDAFRISVSADALARVREFQAALTSTVTVSELEEVDDLQSAVSLIGRNLLHLMQECILEFHPAHEEAVNLYFDYAHVLSVESRVNHMAAEMHALADLMSGEPIVGRT
jgi:hypothetical protein